MVEAMLLRAGGDDVAARSRLREALAEPDAHWHQSIAFWLVVLVASLSDDLEGVARALGAAAAQFAHAQEIQPSWVTAELEALRARDEGELEPGVLAGALAGGERLTREQAVELGRRLIDD